MCYSIFLSGVKTGGKSSVIIPVDSDEIFPSGNDSISWIPLFLFFISWILYSFNKNGEFQKFKFFQGFVVDISGPLFDENRKFFS